MTTATDVTAGYVALRRGVGAVRIARDVLVARGPEVAEFLHGQLSQDVTGLAVGASRWSFVLQPQGMVEALLRVSRAGDEVFVLDVDAGFGEATRARLERFKLRVDAELEPVEWQCVAVRAPELPELTAPDDGVCGAVVWPGIRGVDLLGPHVEVPAGTTEAPLEAYEAVRVECGWPMMGHEITEKTIPAATGLVGDDTVSFTKGCYVGQELVARIDSRGGNVPRLLRGVVVTTNVLPPVGAEIRAGERTVGSLTSVAESLDRRAPVALASVHRSVEVPAEVELTWEGGGAPARVEALPLV